MFLAATQSNAQKTVINSNGESSKYDPDKIQVEGYVRPGPFKILNSYYSPDTIRTTMIIADTSKLTNAYFSHSNTTEKPAFFNGAVYSIAIIGYRVVSFGVNSVTYGNHRIENMQEYLDIDKRPLPKSFIVISFADTK